jgi:hypothetical protein
MRSMGNLKNQSTFKSISDITKLPVETLEKLALFSTTELVARGLSNAEVAKIVGITPEDVADDVGELVGGFKGFVANMQVNPLRVYQNVNGDLHEFVSAFEVYGFSELEARKLFFFLGNFLELRKYLDQVYGIGKE